MSFSAFKSSTSNKRGTFGNTRPSSSSSSSSSSSTNSTSSSLSKESNAEDLSKKISHRRSRSVSAVSRSCTLSNVVDFSYKMDNPLFCSTSSSPSPPALLEPEVIKVEENAPKFITSPTKSEGNCVSDSRRGRSVLRNSECGNQILGAGKDIGRISSRVDTGRRQRSLSRGRHESSEVWGQSASTKSECGNPVLGARKEIGRSSSRVDTGRRQRSLSRGRHESSEVWGQSALRNSECGNQVLGARKEIGRSSSRVDTGRRQRSLSRGCHESSEVWGQSASRKSDPLDARKDRSSSRVDTGRHRRSLSRGPHESSEKKINVSASASDQSMGMRTLQKWSSQHPFSEPSDGFSTQSSLQPTNWEDGISTGSLSEVEEKTIKVISEPMKSFQVDHPPGDAENGGIYETVPPEIRRTDSEIQNDLENSLKRSRKLQEDLAVEKHHQEELRRILEEMPPEPKSVEPQRSRPRRKNSVERWKMSKRLAEEAMNYFDECVSISTFDSSDFSSPEDQPVSLSAAPPPPVGDNKFLPSTCSSASANFCINGQESDNQIQSMLSHEPLDLTACSSSKNSIRDQENQDSSRDTEQPRNLQFSFAHEASESVGLYDDIRSYIKKFKKEIRKDGNKDSKGVIRSSYYDAEDYELQVLNERLLFDKVIFKSRIETGGLHLCCGNGVTF